MDLTVLGCSGSYSTAHSQCSGYLLRHEGAAVWMDAGNGTLSELQRHIALDELDGIILSHAHPDHCADMYPFFFEQLFACRAAPPVITPPGVRDRLESLIGDDSKDRWRSMLDWREFAAGDETELGPFAIRFFDAAHSIVNNSMRITAGGKTLTYSGDTGPNEHLVPAARDADLFLCEASWLDEHLGLMGPIHLTARQAGEAARAAGAGRLVLTHIWASNDLDVVRAQASEAFGDDVALAIETGTMTI